MQASKRWKYIFHFLYALIYIGFLLLDKQWFSRSNDWESFLPTFIVHLLLMVLLVYSNTLILIPQLLQRKKILAYVFFAVLMIVVYTLVKTLYNHYMSNLLFGMNEHDSIWNHFWPSLTYGIWFMIVSTMLYITQEWFDQREQVKNIQVSQLQTELKYLRGQINPHFLFNGLNTIYGSIDASNEQARDILLRFSGLLRYSLYEADVDSITLGREIRHLEDYIALQKARSNENLRVELTIEVSNQLLQLAPLIFLPLVENAFKFSTNEDNKPDFVRIRLVQSGNRINFKISNSFEQTEQKAAGIGLINLQRRLEILYPSKHIYRVSIDNNIYTASLIIDV